MTEQATPRTGPLAGVTVLDLTQHLSGPHATMILGDFGARVIKVEPPAGDPTRRIGPYFEDGDSDYYHAANRNKESVVLDLKAPGGREALLALAAKSDVVVENFRPGTLEKLGIGFEALSGANPRIVLCSVTGFGQTGPYIHRPAFDIIVQGLAGGMSLTGEADGRPVRSGLPIGDVVAGVYAAAGALAGLVEVARTGRGTTVDVSMLDTQVALLSYVGTYYLASGDVPGPQGRGHMSIPTYRAFTCGDGKELVVAANTEPFWQGLARAFGVPELVDDPRFLDNELRREHRPELDAILEARADALTAPVLLARLTEEGVPSAPINDVAAALADPEIRERDMVLTLAGRGDSIRTLGSPVKFSAGPAAAVAAPRLGADTANVLRDVAGYDDDRLAELAASGAVPVAFGDEGTRRA
ncbi:MAG: CoA transferase [Microbacteriaceae bacterium]|nr:CoA transferase [Microbacteriaceae bacterium]